MPIKKSEIKTELDQLKYDYMRAYQRMWEARKRGKDLAAYPYQGRIQYDPRYSRTSYAQRPSYHRCSGRRRICRNKDRERLQGQDRA